MEWWSNYPKIEVNLEDLHHWRKSLSPPNCRVEFCANGASYFAVENEGQRRE